jgi:hypothetical protein
MIESPAPKQKNVICFKNREWKDGDPQEKMFYQVPLPDDAEDAEIIPTVRGYTIQYTYREVRHASVVLQAQQERICHRKLLFNESLEQIAEHIRFTEWQDHADRRVIVDHGLILPTRPS